MLGLKRGIVRLVPHDASWSVVFADSARAILAHTGLAAARIQHVGSTAVPGLLAKPILDIVVGGDGRDSIDRLASQIVELGYIDRGTGEGSNGLLLVRESAPEVRTIHVHIVVYDSDDWRDYVVFRNALRSDAALLQRYAQLKRELIERFSGERKSYTNGKEPFIRDVLSSSSRAPP